MMDRAERASLDAYITGNYGEDNAGDERALEDARGRLHDLCVNYEHGCQYAEETRSCALCSPHDGTRPTCPACHGEGVVITCAIDHDPTRCPAVAEFVETWEPERPEPWD